MSTQKEIHARFYQKRKESGLCVNCGKKMDRDGSYCISCNDKRNSRNRADKQWYRENKICPGCGKNKLLGQEKKCPECIARGYAYAVKHNKTIDRESYNLKHSERARNEHQNRINQGICTRCGKRKADYGYKTCGICRNKKNEYRRMKYGKPDRSERYKDGLCYFCDSPVKIGFKVCEKHYETVVNMANSENAKAARKNSPWVKDNRIIFKSKGRREPVDRERVSAQQEIP